tara:strand:+ start:285 stop:500 length:216 start_codon:yes stop_codon:yes gene_type:complete
MGKYASTLTKNEHMYFRANPIATCLLCFMNKKFIEIIQRLIKEKKELQKKLNVMEAIVRSYLPIINKKKEK